MTYPSNVGGASLVGTGGSSATTLNYSGTGDAIQFQTDGLLSGSIKGLTIAGTGVTAAQSGLHTGSTIGSKLDDLTIKGFNMCIHIENASLGGGQDYYERNSLTNIEVSGCTYGIYIEKTTGTDSLGYNHFTRWTHSHTQANMESM